MPVSRTSARGSRESSWRGFLAFLRRWRLSLCLTVIVATGPPWWSHLFAASSAYKTPPVTVVAALSLQSNLSGFDLAGLDLARAALSGKNLSYVDLEDADLNDAHLVGTNLDHANLDGASLRGVDFQHASLRYPQISGTDFSGSDFTDAMVGIGTQPYWNSANFAFAVFKNTHGTMILQDADASHVVLDAFHGVLMVSFSDLRRAYIEGAAGSAYAWLCKDNLAHASLAGTFYRQSFAGSNLTAATALPSTNFNEADFRDTDLRRFTSLRRTTRLTRLPVQAQAYLASSNKRSPSFENAGVDSATSNPEAATKLGAKTWRQLSRSHPCTLTKHGFPGDPYF